MRRPASKSFLKALRASDRRRTEAAQTVSTASTAPAAGREALETKKPARGARAADTSFSAADWRDIYEALMDAANQYHSGPRADRAVTLARKIREEKMT